MEFELNTVEEVEQLVEAARAADKQDITRQGYTRFVSVMGSEAQAFFWGWRAGRDWALRVAQQIVRTA